LVLRIRLVAGAITTVLASRIHEVLFVPGAYVIPSTVFYADGSNIAFVPTNKIDNRSRLRTSPSIDIALILLPSPILIPRSWLVATIAQPEPIEPVWPLYQSISGTPIIFASHLFCFLPVNLSLSKEHGG
jgi:hypothetical protein